MTQNKKNFTSEIDWAFLLFIIGATYVKLYVKLAAIILYSAYVIYNRYNKPSANGFGKFYFIMPVIGTIGSFLHHSFEADGYWFAYVMSVLNWVMAGGIIYLLSSTVQTLQHQKIYATIKAFFFINAIFSLGELGKMIIDSGQLMPYWYWEPTEYYGGSTGDHIKGITGHISVTNATINAIAALYFTYKKEMKWAALTLLILLLCTSNVTLILLMVMFIAMLILVKDKQVKVHTLYALLMIGVVYPFLSLNNIKYVEHVYNRETVDSTKVEAEKQSYSLASKREKEYFDYGTEVSATQKFELDKGSKYRMKKNDTSLISYKDDLKYMKQLGLLKSKNNTNLLMEPGDLKNTIEHWYGIQYSKTPLSYNNSLVKLYTFKQTLFYLTTSKKNLLFGAGIANFSSKQAIKATGLGLQGSYPVQYVYVSNDFLVYHLYSLLYVFSMPISEHSIINMPNSIYNQVGGEYGLAGILAFLLLYIGYIIKHFKKLKAALYLTPLFMMFLGFEYWFETLSLTVIFELLILMDIYNKQDEPA